MSSLERPDESEGSPVCAVTRAMSKKCPEEPEVDHFTTLVVPSLLHCIPHNELAMEQLADPSLKGIFEHICPIEDFDNASWGYFLQNGVLVRKWVPSCDNFVGEPVVQIVVPQKFRQLVLKAAHDSVAGHMGVKKTYAHILQLFFGHV